MRKVLIAMAVLAALPAVADDSDQVVLQAPLAIVEKQKVEQRLTALSAAVSDAIGRAKKDKRQVAALRDVRQQLDDLRDYVSGAPAPRELFEQMRANGQWRDADRGRDRDRDDHGQIIIVRGSPPQPGSQQPPQYPPQPGSQQPPQYPPQPAPPQYPPQPAPPQYPPQPAPQQYPPQPVPQQYPPQPVPQQYPPPGVGQPPPPAPPINAYPIQEAALQTLVGAIEHQSFAADRLRVLGQATPQSYFLVAQVRRLLGEFDFAGDKLKAMKLLKGRILDTENYFQLYAAFDFQNDKEQLRQLLSQP